MGGGRKGLPSSFLNRFTKIMFDELPKEDIMGIVSDVYKGIEQDLIHKVLIVMAETGYCNLRDMLRFCEIYWKT